MHKIAILLIIGCLLCGWCSSQGVAEFSIVSRAELFPSNTGSSPPVIVRRDQDSYCFMYRSSNTTRLIYGIGYSSPPTMQSMDAPLYSEFTVIVVSDKCYFMFAQSVIGDQSLIVYTEDTFLSKINMNTFTDRITGISGFATGTTMFTLMVAFEVNITFTSFKPAFIVFDVLTTVPGSIAVSPTSRTWPGNTEKSVYSLNYSPVNANNHSVVYMTDTYIWAGKYDGALQPPGFPASTIIPAQSPRGLDNVIFASKTLGYICHVLAEILACTLTDPSGSIAIEGEQVFTAPVPLTFAKPAISRSDTFSTELFVFAPTDEYPLKLYHLQNTTLIKEVNVTIPEGTVIPGAASYSATEMGGNNRIFFLTRNNENGQVDIYQIQYQPAPPTTPISPGPTPSGTFIPNSDSPLNSRAPSSTPDASGSTTPTDPLGAEVIAPAVVVPVVVAAAGLVLLLVLLRRRKKRQNGGSLLHGKSRVEIAMESIDDRLKIPYKALVFKKEIGAGSYGKVFFGEWKGTPVAIKVSSSVSDMDGFFDEARITVGLQQHPNVVQTFGVSLDGQLPCIVLEFCEGGSLDNRLFDSDVSMTLQQKISLIKGVARGLYHLHSNNIVHRDLAARNVLLNKSGTPKISDFGMSRVLKSEAEKGKTRTNYGPIRWMAPESLKDLQYSTKSDVWSFGIVVYEILNRSEPHIDVDPLEVAVKIKNESYHPPVPVGTEPVLGELLLSCWQPDPNNRPSMEEVCAKLNASFPE